MQNAPIIIAGSGRSGTTWVLDAIAQANNMRTVFEPLNPIAVPSAEPFANKYVRNDACFPELKFFMDKVFSGKLRGLWVNYRIRPNRLHLNIHEPGSLRHKLGSLKHSYEQLVFQYLKYHRLKSRDLIVKFIRSNLMLGWLCRNYGAKSLLIVRHPGAVVASKMRLGGPNWKSEAVLQQYLQDKHLMGDYLNKFKETLTRPLSPLEAHAVVWCIENSLPIRNARENGQLVVSYEYLLLYPDTEWKRIINSLDLTYLPEKDHLSHPSQQVSKEMSGRAFDTRQISRWMDTFSKRELMELDGILKAFDISFYKAFEPIPVHRIQV